ncbi:LysR family transcriptional regulator [Nocardia sp. NPDC052566]|uniref:LysR family transcriptional regulator n=1 Tax=Nocardia sp. NPDC052566 TaxID=3364330 RepID=UPI0037C7D576
MERYEIEAFLTLAEELHFGRAAEQLRVSTGRISQTIQSIERRIGTALFERTSRRVALTPVGARFRDELRPGYDLIQQAVRAATAAGRGVPGVVSVGFTGPGSGKFVLDAAAILSGTYPETEVQIRELPLFKGIAALRDDLVEVVLSCEPVDEPDLSVGPVLRRLPLLLAVPNAHPLARRDALTIEDLADITLIGIPSSSPAIELGPQHTQSGRPIRYGRTAKTLQEAISLVGAGEGGFLVGDEGPCFRTHPHVTYVPIEDAPDLESRLIWRTSRENARIRAFAEAARTASETPCHSTRSAAR